ncbi:alpha/beta hydrolase [Gordonia sp. HY442]|uniref:alpha/beta hydrolase family protein n=1 Tax=Gordonia zhenghanii TaxID=2911516 RepID=UPI001F26CE4E|nr:alpha/beta hydrolase [Gordonia zhenghanii]MCF8606775.1 alpha/beta hydrolase [Gordonia zhenghanii]
MRRSLFALTAAVAAIMLVLTGCSTTGSGSDPLGPDPTSTSPGHPAPVPDGVTKSRVQYYSGPDADPDQNWADFYLPAGDLAVDTVPLVVLVHGGAWKMPLGAEIFDGIAGDLAARGMAVYNIEYRRVGAGGGWPATFVDVARALDYVVELDAAHPEITTGDEVVVGHSAGAQLAVWGGTRHELEPGEVGARPAFRPKRVVSLAGPLDMVQAVKDGDDRIVAALGGEPQAVPKRYSAVDPIQNLDPAIPVAAIHGKNDSLVLPHNSIRYVAALDKAGGKGYLRLLDGETHTSIVSRRSVHYQRVLDLVSKYADTEIAQLPT